VPGGKNVQTLVFDAATTATVELWDWAGRKRMELNAASVNAAAGTAYWDGRTIAGEAMPPGVYFFVVKTDLAVRRAKFTLVWP
jgi:hypothetical protein